MVTDNSYVFGLGLHVSATGLCYRIRIGHWLLSDQRNFRAETLGTKHSNCNYDNVQPPSTPHVRTPRPPAALRFPTAKKIKHKNYLYASMCNFFCFCNCDVCTRPALPCKQEFILVKRKPKHSQEVNLMHAGRFRHSQTLPAWRG